MTSTPTGDGADHNRPFKVLNWSVEPLTNRIRDDQQTQTLEPKVMDLLVYLAHHPGQVMAKDILSQALWPDMIVGEDTLARTISKLRRALGDDTQQPRFIETIPKRGYRLIAPVICENGARLEAAPLTRAPARLVIGVGLALGFALLLIILTLDATKIFAPERATAPPDDRAHIQSLSERGTDLYMRFTRADNEAAIILFERAMSLDPDYAPAQAGLANALVQRVIRWQSPAGAAPSATSLNEALSQGLTQTQPSTAILNRAVDLGQRAVRLSPRNPDAHKALGFAYSAQGDLPNARDSYLRAIALDPEAWEAMTNMGELASIEGDRDQALHWFEEAYGVMDQIYTQEPQRIGPWRAPLGVLIGDLYRLREDRATAEIWYRRVLDQTPLDPEATARLAHILYTQGDQGEAHRLCQGLQARIGSFEDCRFEE